MPPQDSNSQEHTPQYSPPQHGQDQQTYKRAAAAALVGLIVQLGLAIAMALLGIYAQSAALHAASWYLFGGLPIWVILLILFHQHRLERLEALEAEQLARADARTAAIFDEAGQQLQLARTRLENLYRFALPAVGVLVAGYLLIVGLVLLYIHWGYAGSNQLEQQALANTQANTVLMGILLAAIAFGAFLISRYVSGMTQVKDWALLRGGASYLMGNAVVSVLLVVGAFFAYLQNLSALGVLAIVVPAFMAVLGVEMIVGLIFSMYRPRRPGEVMRPAFDSRILGWLTRPESIGKIVSETLNYQFGFEISKSWFYLLLSRAITPLIIIGLVVLIGLTSIVIVAPEQQAVITTFGAFNRVAEPGAHLKWPWPVSRAEKHNVYRVRQLTVGSLTGGRTTDEAVLWTNEHGEGDEQFLLTAPSSPNELEEGDVVDGELVGAQVAINWRIDDLGKYVKAVAGLDGDGKLNGPERLLEQIAASRVSSYFVTRDIDTLLSEDRHEAGKQLRQQIQRDVDSMLVEQAGTSQPQKGLGLEVVFVGIVNIHPPQTSDVATKFHEQIGAVQEREAEIQRALKEAISTLAGVAGSADTARDIKSAIQELRRLEQKAAAARREQGDDAEQTQQLAQRVAEQQVEVESLMNDAGGEAAQQIHNARAYRWSKALAEAGRAARFEAQVAAYEKAPRFYTMRHYLDAMALGLKDRRKFLMTAEQKSVPTIRLNLESASSELESLFESE